MTTEEMNDMENVFYTARGLQDRIQHWRDILDDVTRHEATLFVAYRPDELCAKYEEIVGLAEAEDIRNCVMAEIRRRIDDAQKEFDELELPGNYNHLTTKK